MPRRRDPGRRRALCFAVFLAIVLFSVVDHYIVSLARQNLSNAGFDRAYDTTPDDVGIPFADVSIPSEGVTLAGWWMPGPAESPNATATVVLVHGHSATMGKLVRQWAPNLHSAGYSLLAFDLRNHGSSSDGPRGFVTYGAAEAKDVLAAVFWLRSHANELGIDAGRIALSGQSMGAVSVLLAAAEASPGVQAVWSDSAYASFRFQAELDGAKKGYPGPLIDWVVSYMGLLAPAPLEGSAPDSVIAEIRVPLLLAHCADDARIQAASFHRLLETAQSGGLVPTTWLEPCPKGESKDHHVDGWANPGYNATVRSFLADAFR